MITKEEVSELLEYDSVTGVFTWRISRGGAKAGSIAGYKMKAGSNNYVQIGIKGKLYLAHRLALFLKDGAWPNEVDHINGDGLDNRIINLREVTSIENSRNMGMRKSNKSGVIGVSYDSTNEKWRATIKVRYKQIHIGRFKTKEEAIEARSAAETLYGFHENHGRPAQCH